MRRQHQTPGQATLSTVWPGRLYLWGGRALYVGRSFDTSLHAHHAVQVCVATEGSLRLRTAYTRRWRRYDAVAIESDQPHQLDGGGNYLALLYLDPETVEARVLRQGMRGRNCGVVGSLQRSAILSKLHAWSAEDTGSEEAAQFCDEVVRILIPSADSSLQLDRRVARVLDLLRTAPERRIALAELAAAVSLSPGRLVHLFRAETGLPIRRYLLWLRLADALQQVVWGLSLTEAAHAAGFADSAHLSRTFRRMLGLQPSALARR